VEDSNNSVSGNSYAYKLVRLKICAISRFLQLVEGNAPKLRKKELFYRIFEIEIKVYEGFLPNTKLFVISTNFMSLQVPCDLQGISKMLRNNDETMATSRKSTDRANEISANANVALADRNTFEEKPENETNLCEDYRYNKRLEVGD